MKQTWKDRTSGKNRGLLTPDKIWINKMCPKCITLILVEETRANAVNYCDTCGTKLLSKT